MSGDKTHAMVTVDIIKHYIWTNMKYKHGFQQSGECSWFKLWKFEFVLDVSAVK